MHPEADLKGTALVFPDPAGGVGKDSRCHSKKWGWCSSEIVCRVGKGNPRICTRMYKHWAEKQRFWLPQGSFEGAHWCKIVLACLELSTFSQDPRTMRPHFPNTLLAPKKATGKGSRDSWGLLVVLEETLCIMAACIIHESSDLALQPVQVHRLDFAPSPSLCHLAQKQL